MAHLYHGPRQHLPRAIARAVLANLRESIVPMLYSTVAPSAYVVYLHPEDFALIEDVVPLIAKQIDQAIDEAVVSLNARGPWQRIVRLMRKPLPPIQVDTRRTIEIVPDPNDELQRGQVAVHSDVRLPSFAFAGTPTMQVMTTGPVAPTMPRALAFLTISDLAGQHEHPVVENPTLIGRGGSGCDVHVRLRAEGEVSKVHCRLARNDAGVFLLTDLSRNGTSVDGERIVPGVDVPLPPRARIGLADAILIEFRRDAAV